MVYSPFGKIAQHFLLSPLCVSVPLVPTRQRSGRVVNLYLTRYLRDAVLSALFS
jgi:hypothetical protein